MPPARPQVTLSLAEIEREGENLAAFVRDWAVRHPQQVWALLDPLLAVIETLPQPPLTAATLTSPPTDQTSVDVLERTPDTAADLRKRVTGLERELASVDSGREALVEDCRAAKADVLRIKEVLEQAKVALRSQRLQIATTIACTDSSGGRHAIPGYWYEKSNFKTANTPTSTDSISMPPSAEPSPATKPDRKSVAPAVVIRPAKTTPTKTAKAISPAPLSAFQRKKESIERLIDNVEVQHPEELAATTLSLDLIERMTIALNRMEIEEDEEYDEVVETTTATKRKSTTEADRPAKRPRLSKM
ncbi:MAG: hypothetical protein M1826_002748 [Phylliscum demangeonii]|nr:MAG: hypothetical protein M1826_002748 [Phylliscum demangeonii]